jgi:hypothetical protein
MVDDKTDPKSDEAARYGHFSLNDQQVTLESIDHLGLGGGISAQKYLYLLSMRPT